MSHERVSAPGASRASGDDPTVQFLTFRLGDEEYAVDILKVQEIKGYPAVARLPNTPPFIKGVLNLRGVVVPVMDLRARFGLEATIHDRSTVVIIVMVGARVVGLVVDSVSDVLDLPASAVQPPPELGAHVDTSFLTGMARKGEHLVILLDLEKLLCGDEVAAGVPV